MFLRNIEDNPSVKYFLKILEKVDPALAAKIPTINPFLQLQVRLTYFLISFKIHWKFI